LAATPLQSLGLGAGHPAVDQRCSPWQRVWESRAQPALEQH